MESDQCSKRRYLLFSSQDGMGLKIQTPFFGTADRRKRHRAWYTRLSKLGPCHQLGVTRNVTRLSRYRVAQLLPSCSLLPLWISTVKLGCVSEEEKRQNPFQMLSMGFVTRGYPSMLQVRNHVVSCSLLSKTFLCCSFLLSSQKMVDGNTTATARASQAAGITISSVDDSLV